GVGEELEKAGALRILEGRRAGDFVDGPLADDGVLAARIADGCHLRIGENRSRNGAVVGDAVATRDVRCGDPALVLADVRELRDSRHVPGGPDVLGRAKTLVHLDALPPDLQAEV